MAIALEKQGTAAASFRWSKLVSLLRTMAPGVVLLCVWEFGAHFLFDPRFVGQPSQIIASFVAHFQTAQIWVHVSITFQEIAFGYIIGVLFGGMVGYALGLNRTLASIFEPYILAINAIPKVAIAPLIIMAFGIGMTSKIVIVALLVFFLMFYAVYLGVRTIDVDFLYQARIMGARRWEEIRYVIIPAIMPNILTGMRTSSVYAVIGAVIGEYIAAHAGLGFFILNAAGVFNVNDIWVGVAYLMMVLLAMAAFLGYLERRLLRWLPRKNLR